MAQRSLIKRLSKRESCATPDNTELGGENSPKMQTKEDLDDK
jgi:hypothetical protein